MAGKRERLRSGENVEVEPGVFGRLNKSNRTLELSSGEVLPVSQQDQRDLFPENEQALDLSRRKEKLGKQIQETPGGEFLYQFGQSGLANAAKNWVNKFSMKPDQYQSQQEAERQVSSRISGESPFTSGAATVASFAPDIALTGGMSALKAAPILTGLHAGPRIIEEPGHVAQEVALSSAGGFLIDKGSNALNKISTRRGEVRALPGQQEAVRKSNILGKQSVEESNLIEKQKFNLMNQNVKNVNETRLKQYQDDLNVRQNQIIQDQNAFQTAKSSRDSEIVRLKNEAELAKTLRSANKIKAENEYRISKEAAEKEDKLFSEKFKLEQKQYAEDLKKLPEAQRMAQKEFSENIVANSKQIERSFPKNSKIYMDELEVESFIENSILKSGLAGSPQASQASRVLKSLFPEGEFISVRELSQRYKSLEDAIQRSTPEVQTVLNDFKQHLGERLPNILENTITYNRIVPLLKKTLEKDVRSIIGEMNLGKESELLLKNASFRANQILDKEINSVNFVQKIQNGELAQDISSKIMTAEDFITAISPEQLKYLKKQGLTDTIYNEGTRRHNYFVRELTDSLQNKIARYEIKALESARKSSEKFIPEIQKTYGIAEPVPSPVSPIAPVPVAHPTAPLEPPPISPIQLPASVVSPSAPSMPLKPDLLSQPNAPIAQKFTPQLEPTLPPAQGISERTGDLLEKNLLGGRGLVNNPLTKLAGLKYALGSAALPAEAAYLGLKGLTSPTSAGQAARLTFKQAGIEAIDSWARKYPSYHDGILENPQERRSLTKEIEDDQNIPIEQKSVIQSKINRGKPLEGSL